MKADSAERLFSRGTLGYIQKMTGDIERVDTVQQVYSLATATIVQALPVPPGASADEADGGLDVRPLLENLDSRDPADIRKRALADDLIRGDLVSEDARTTAIIVSFDEDRIDAVRGGVIQRIHDIVDPQLPGGVAAYYNGSLEISETYNRITLDNQRKFTPPILVFTILAIYLAFRSVRKTVLALVAISVSVLWTLGLYSLMGFSFNVLASMLVPLVVVLAIADDVHIMQHWDEMRREGDAEHAFKATVTHLAAPLLRRQRHDRARHVVARDQQRRRGEVVRHRLGDRDHGRLRHLPGAGADDAVAGEAGDGEQRRTRSTSSGRSGASPASPAPTRAGSSPCR